jgi:hypothetical protein
MIFAGVANLPLVVRWAKLELALQMGDHGMYVWYICTIILQTSF